MDAYLQRLQEAIASATHGMTAEDLRRHPEGKWSTAEVLEHLYLTYTGTTKAFERCLQDRQAAGANATAEGSHASVCSHRTRPHTRRTKSAGAHPNPAADRRRTSCARSGRASRPWTI